MQAGAEAQRADHGADQRARRDADDEAEPRVDAVAHLQDRGDIGAGAEERRMAERILAAIAAEQVPALPDQRDQQRHHQEIEHDVGRRDQRHGGEQRHGDQDRREALHARSPNSPLGPKQQHQDEHHENADLAERFAEIEPGQALDHADEQSAEQRARHRAHAAEHDDREGDQHEGVAGLRIDVIGRDQQAGRDGKAGGAEAERHRIDVRDIDAGQARRRASPWPPRGSPCRCRSIA